ncbi:MAG: hypothetical protein V1267_01695 [Alphaproteobacteria bacterium]|nr:hypothetical protein [Alphaproteobacteria bacterium]
MKLAISAILVTVILAASSATADAKTPSGPQAVTPTINRVVAGQVSEQIADALAQGQEKQARWGRPDIADDLKRD